MLRGDNDGGFVHWLGVLCASWIVTSRGTTGRSLLVPEGLPHVRSVKLGNLMAARLGFSGKSTSNGSLSPQCMDLYFFYIVCTNICMHMPDIYTYLKILTNYKIVKYEHPAKCSAKRTTK